MSAGGRAEWWTQVVGSPFWLGDGDEDAVRIIAIALAELVKTSSKRST